MAYVRKQCMVQLPLSKHKTAMPVINYYAKF
jgi:hypothetical protein